MTVTTAFAVAIHVLSAIVWIGGMFFAYLFLRPACGPLDPPVRLGLWRRVFDLFLPWVWAAVIGLFASGYLLLFTIYGDFGVAPVHVHIMHAIAIVMAVLFVVLYFVPYPALRHAVDAGKTPDAAAALNRIRQIIAVNLPLGLLNTVIGATGPHWT